VVSHDAVRIQAFIDKWAVTGAEERANKDMFLLELCALIGVPGPDPKTGDPATDLYVFEKDADLQREDGTETTGHVDLYKHGFFALEAKQGSDAGTAKVGSGKRHTGSWIKAMQDAYGQAVSYVDLMDEPPPFVLVCDIGYCFELYACFDGTRRYRDFPNAQRRRIPFREIGKSLDILRTIWTDPMALDPSIAAAKVTREVATHLAELAVTLEKAGHPQELIASFLMRCIFTMFAEDAKLLPERVFSETLETHWVAKPTTFSPEIEELWRKMNTGGILLGRGAIRYFNGGLFADPKAIPLTKEQLTLLLEAARCNWLDVEPSIFGTLLERAIKPSERHRIGAHFTPREYVERLVRPTIEEPMREEWDTVRAQVLQLSGKEAEALALVKCFHKRLCEVRILDPACGSGNFLYVTMDVLKRLESEVLRTMTDLGAKMVSFGYEGHTVIPDQFQGLEIKPWAKEIADLVLWIGYLQWELRTSTSPVIPEPILHDYRNIECRDALLVHDGTEIVTNDHGTPKVEWDRTTMKVHPTTLKDVPDTTAVVPMQRHVNPHQAVWPTADFVVGNPPFIGNKLMRRTLGSPMVEAIRDAHPDVPGSVDLVMYWWYHAAILLKAGKLKRFGFITTKAITQTFNRTVVRRALEDAPTLSVVFAIPNHPWVDSADGADVRIAMTVVAQGVREGRLLSVVAEEDRNAAARAVTFREVRGTIHADLTVGPNVKACPPLKANRSISFMGIIVVGQGFIVLPDDPLIASEPGALRPYVVGNELNRRRRNRYVIDFFGLTSNEARDRWPESYQRVLDRVKPERDGNRDATFKKEWWLHGRPRPEMRAAIAGLSRFITICRTAKHFVFQFEEGSVLMESKGVVIASDDAFHLGVLSSQIHVAWAIATGSRHGVGNDLTYNNSACFETFPFPAPDTGKMEHIRFIAEKIDAHRRSRQALTGITITDMYNVIEKLRAGKQLTVKEHKLHIDGVISVLRELHDELNAVVSEAYGWPTALAEDEVLDRLFALNAERRKAEEAGTVRWLRPEYQVAGMQKEGIQVDLVTVADVIGERGEGALPISPWPKTLPERIAAVRRLVESVSKSWSADTVAGSFKNARRKEVEGLLESLASLGVIASFKTTEGKCWRRLGKIVPFKPPT